MFDPKNKIMHNIIKDTKISCHENRNFKFHASIPKKG